MIAFSPSAARQVAALRQHYEERDRPEAIRSLIAALIEAARTIERDPTAGLVAPRPYPTLARRGRAWIKVSRYWIAYCTRNPLMIVGVFYDAANIPDRA